MLHDRRSGAENQVEKFKMPQEVSRKVECLDSRGNAHSVQLIVRSLLGCFQHIAPVLKELLLRHVTITTVFVSLDI
jgi:hypothetical protein